MLGWALPGALLPIRVPDPRTMVGRFRLPTRRFGLAALCRLPSPSWDAQGGTSLHFAYTGRRTGVDSTPWASDAEVIVASWHDPVRFEVVFSRHFGTVYRFLAGRAPRDEAADLAAEVFVRAFARRRKYRPDRPSALPWLLGMAVNVLREWTRRLARADRAHRRSSSDFQADLDTGDPEARMDAGESAPALRRRASRTQPRRVQRPRPCCTAPTDISGDRRRPRHPAWDGTLAPGSGSPPGERTDWA